jgi:acetyl-CoA carboxylase biotin carboxyl carrier protein
MSSDLPLTAEDVAEIVAILDGTRYERIDIRTSRFALRVARSGDGWTQEWEWQDSGSASVPVASKEAVAAADDAAADDDGLIAIRPPLPGSFYRAPQPGAPPFVEVGDRVEPETVVGIVETMKLMNPVHAGVSGTVAAIIVDNAAQVDAGAVLMRVRPDAP